MASIVEGQSSFKQVEFLNVPECYAPGERIECRFSLSPGFQPTASDWVGVYKVGWLSAKDYFCYVWSPMPSGDADAKGLENFVVIPAASLPKDAGEFYQFCYVSGSGQVCGASCPFQFQVAATLDDDDEVVEFESTDDSEILVVTNKSKLLAKQVDQLQAEKADLQQMVNSLQMELKHSVDEIIDLNGRLESAEAVATELEVERSTNKELCQKLQLAEEERYGQQLDWDMDRRQSAQRAAKLFMELDNERTARARLEEKLQDAEKRLKELQIKKASKEAASEAGVESKDASTSFASVQSDEGGAIAGSGPAHGVAMETPSYDDLGLWEEPVARSPDSKGHYHLTDLLKSAGAGVYKHLRNTLDTFVGVDEGEDDQREEDASATAEQAIECGDGSPCPVCSKLFSSETELLTHLEQHQGPVCPVCNTQFDSDFPEETITAHINRHFDAANP